MFSALEADRGMPQTKEKPAKCKITQLLCPQRCHKLLGPGEMRVTEGARLVRNETVAAPSPQNCQFCARATHSHCPESGRQSFWHVPFQPVNGEKGALGTSDGLITDNSIFRKSYKAKASP